MYVVDSKGHGLPDATKIRLLNEHLEVQSQDMSIHDVICVMFRTRLERYIVSHN